MIRFPITNQIFKKNTKAFATPLGWLVNSDTSHLFLWDGQIRDYKYRCHSHRELTQIRMPDEDGDIRNYFDPIEDVARTKYFRIFFQSPVREELYWPYFGEDGSETDYKSAWKYVLLADYTMSFQPYQTDTDTINFYGLAPEEQFVSVTDKKTDRQVKFNPTPGEILYDAWLAQHDNRTICVLTDKSITIIDNPLV